MKKLSAGFTLVEVMVAVALVAILAGVMYANFQQGSEQTRDTKRQADLRALQNAVELYKNEHGRYPAGCNGPDVWSGQLGTSYECSNGTGIYAAYSGTNQYIIGHDGLISFAPGYISALPTDPKLNGNNSGYAYLVNSDGSVYKLMAARTVETETIQQVDKHEFKSCDVSNSSVGTCDSVSDGSVADDCQDSDVVFRTSYGLWGGYPEENFTCPHVRCEEERELVICEMPS